MKSNLNLYIAAALVLQSAALAPAFADEARHDRHVARHEARRAADSRTDADINAANGHPIRAGLDELHANKEQNRADRHAEEGYNR